MKLTTDVANISLTIVLLPLLLNTGVEKLKTLCRFIYFDMIFDQDED